MFKFIQNPTFKKVFSYIKPWLTVAIVLVVLRYTGLLSGISYLTNRALASTGVMDIAPENNLASNSFSYNFALTDLDDNILDVNTLKGKVIFLNMWATWCGPCRAEMPSIQELYDSIDHDKVVFIMLSLDNPEHQQKVSRYVKDKEFTFPVYMPASELPEQLQVNSIPATFVIGADGKIKMKKTGTANYATEKFKKFLMNLTLESSR